MEGIIVLIGILIAIVNAANKSKKVKGNAPGQAGRTVLTQKPAQQIPAVQNRIEPVIPAASPAHIQQSVQPIQKRVEDAAPEQENFWWQMAEAVKKELEGEEKVNGHETISQISEGESRECEHGAVGGSMAYDSHEGGRMIQDAPEQRSDEWETETYRPAINAEEMRRAVIMAEILKRPQERMTEQARRWSLK